ncbi:MAG: hypothetical protein ACRDN9_16805, partial [Streptosporangiaceae bacterium]
TRPVPARQAAPAALQPRQPQTHHQHHQRHAEIKQPRRQPDQLRWLVGRILLRSVTDSYNRGRGNVGLPPLAGGRTVFDALVSPYLHLRAIAPVEAAVLLERLARSRAPVTRGETAHGAAPFG